MGISTVVIFYTSYCADNHSGRNILIINKDDPPVLASIWVWVLSKIQQQVLRVEEGDDGQTGTNTNDE